MCILEVRDEFSFKLYPEIKEGVILEALKGECITYNLPDEVYEVLIVPGDVAQAQKLAQCLQEN